MHEIDRMLRLQLEGRHDEARILSDKLERIGKDKILDPNGKNTADVWLRHCFNRGWFILQDGDYQKGSQLLEHGRFLNVYGNGRITTNAPIYNPNEHDIKDKSIIVSLEGGYGDEIIHARFATSFKKQGAKHVYIASSPELVSVFERIEGVDKVILRNQIHTVQHDYWVPGFSAGWIAGHTFDDFPGEAYLTPKPDMVDKWKDIIKSNEGKLKVGIRWAGNPKFEHQQFRKFPKDFMLNLNKYSELQLYSFQRDDNLAEKLPDDVIDLQHKLTSWEDTLGAIANLDIMITSCTSVAHIAAGMGVETWVVVPILPYHTWTYKCPESRTSPYYNSVRLFRQTKQYKWNSTFQLLYSELEERFNLKHVEHTDEDPVLHKLNLGCGFYRVEGFTNIDIDPIVKPDKIVDLNVLPWPFEDDSVAHIVMKDVLEHLGNTSEDFINIIKELHRISADGAVWEIQCPHWNSDTAVADPDHKRVITPSTFELFDKLKMMDRLREGMSDSILAYKHNIDIELAQYDFQYMPHWQQQITSKKITKEELDWALNTYNNVAIAVMYLVNVHKPGRANQQELRDLIENLPKKVMRLNKNDL